MVTPLIDGDPKRIGSWTILSRLGVGGMGVVYLGARGVERAAVKAIQPAFAHDPDFRQRFRREVLAGRKVRGAQVAQVIDADTDGDRPWLATQYIAGPTLAEAVRAEPAVGTGAPDVRPRLGRGTAPDPRRRRDPP